MNQQLFDAATVTQAATIAAGWTVPSTAFHLFLSDHVKQYAWIRNRAVIFIAPVAALIAFGAVLVAAKYLEYSVNPVTGLGFFMGHLGGSFGARVAYKAQAEGGSMGNIPVIGGLFQSGPLNNTQDAAQAAKPPPPPPATSDETPPPAPAPSPAPAPAPPTPPPPPVNPFVRPPV